MSEAEKDYQEMKTSNAEFLEEYLHGLSDEVKKAFASIDELIIILLCCKEIQERGKARTKYLSS